MDVSEKQVASSFSAHGVVLDEFIQLEVWQRLTSLSADQPTALLIEVVLYVLAADHVDQSLRQLTPRLAPGLRLPGDVP